MALEIAVTRDFGGEKWDYLFCVVVKKCKVFLVYFCKYNSYRVQDDSSE